MSIEFYTQGYPQRGRLLAFSLKLCYYIYSIENRNANHGRTIMLRTSLVALAALFISMQPVMSDEMDLDQVEDLAFYTPDYKGPIAPLSWDPDNSVVHPGLSSKILYSLQDDYRAKATDENRRFAGHHMVLVEGCGGYLSCGAVLDLTTGQPTAQLPTAGPKGYEFYGDCDVLWVSEHRGDGWQPYRLVSGTLQHILDGDTDCRNYYGNQAVESFPTLPMKGPLPEFMLDRTPTGSIN